MLADDGRRLASSDTAGTSGTCILVHSNNAVPELLKNRNSKAIWRIERRKRLRARGADRETALGFRPHRLLAILSAARSTRLRCLRASASSCPASIERRSPINQFFSRYRKGFNDIRKSACAVVRLRCKTL